MVVFNIVMRTEMTCICYKTYFVASDHEKDEDLEPKRKKKKTIAIFKPKPSKPTSAKPKMKKRRSRTTSDLTTDADSRTLRKSTQERSQEFKERYEEKTRRKYFTKKRTRTVHKRLTQEELLAEAKRTERENLASLEAYTRLEAEKKKVKEKSHEIKGPFIRFHSVVMPLIEDIGKEKKSNELTSKPEEKYSRNFMVFTDTKSFPHQYFPQNKPKVAKPQFCSITGLPARYIDPITKTPYATTNAFKVIRNQYVSQEEIKCEKRLLQLSNWLEEKKRKKMEVS